MKIFINSLDSMFDSLSAIKTPDEKSFNQDKTQVQATKGNKAEKQQNTGSKVSKPSKKGKNGKNTNLDKNSKNTKKPNKAEVEQVMGDQIEEEPSDSDRKMSAIDEEGNAEDENSEQEAQGIVIPQTEQAFQLSMVVPRAINYNPIPNVDTLIADNLHTKVVMVIKSPSADYNINQQGIILERTDFIPFKNALLRAQLHIDSNKSKAFKVNIQLSTGSYRLVYDAATKVLNLYSLDGSKARMTPRLTLNNETLQAFLLRFS